MKITTKAAAALLVAGLVAAPVLGTSAASAASTLPQPVQDALTAALQDEYNAQAFYAAVMDKFGTTRPFSNIILAEQMHESWVIDLMKTYGMSVPDNTAFGSAEVAASVPATIGDACAVGVQAEIDNAALYDNRLLPAVTAYPDITAVFEQLSAASQNQHLPAFQRCAI